MDPLTLALLSFIFVAGAAYLAGSFGLRRWFALRVPHFRSPVLQSGLASIARWQDRTSGWWQRKLERLGRAFGPRDNVKLSRARERLVLAGYHNPRAVVFFMGAQAGLGILCGYAYTLYGLAIQRALPNILTFSALLAVAGAYLPKLWLRRRIRARQRDILHAMPNVLDLLMVCVEAGMGFDAAVARIADQPETRRSPLHQELLRMHHEVRAGRPREEALRALGERTGVQELKAVIAGFVQTERLGTSLGKTLRVHAESARMKRRQRAEERAQMAPLKMIFPTVLFLFPVFFLVTLVPSILRLTEAMKAMGVRP